MRPGRLVAALAAVLLMPGCAGTSSEVSPPAEGAVIVPPSPTAPSPTAPSPTAPSPTAPSSTVPAPTGEETIPPPTADPVVRDGVALLPRDPRLRLPGAQDLPRAAKEARPSGPMTFTQANLYTGMTTAQFADDLGAVVASRPDFVTLNEAHRRSPGELAPPGYAAYRAEAPKYARETPVLWRTDRWTRVDAGTFLMHDRAVKWGTRYANWVTLEEIATGARLSVISAHASPRGVGRQGLLTEFLARLDLLAGELRERGPVLVGADLNCYYESSPFLARSFPRSGARSTFDLLGEPLGGWATGDGGRTIDYIFTAGGALAVRHSTSPLAYSDHRMLSATVDVLPGG